MFSQDNVPKPKQVYMGLLLNTDAYPLNIIYSIISSFDNASEVVKIQTAEN
jgi:hypothetical protein